MRFLRIWLCTTGVIVALLLIAMAIFAVGNWLVGVSPWLAGILFFLGWTAILAWTVT